MILTTHFNQVPPSRMAKLCDVSPIRLHGLFLRKSMDGLYLGVEVTNLSQDLPPRLHTTLTGTNFNVTAYFWCGTILICLVKDTQNMLMRET
jgi:hypothetical protein